MCSGAGIDGVLGREAKARLIERFGIRLGGGATTTTTGGAAAGGGAFADEAVGIGLAEGKAGAG